MKLKLSITILNNLRNYIKRKHSLENYSENANNIRTVPRLTVSNVVEFVLYEKNIEIPTMNSNGFA